MRLLFACLAAALALAPVALAQDGFETDPPCETGAEACADAPGGQVGTGQEVPSQQDPAGGGQGEGVPGVEPYSVSSYLPWIVLSVVLVAGLVAALGYTVRRASPDRMRERR